MAPVSGFKEPHLIWLIFQYFKDKKYIFDLGYWDTSAWVEVNSEEQLRAGFYYLTGPSAISTRIHVDDYKVFCHNVKTYYPGQEFDPANPDFFQTIEKLIFRR